MSDDERKSPVAMTNFNPEIEKLIESLNESSSEKSFGLPLDPESVLNIHDQLTNDVIQKLNIRDSWILIAGGSGGCGKGF